jgi:hypothetical protein
VLADDLKGTTVVKLTLHSETPGLSQSLILLQHPQLNNIDQGISLIRDAIKNPLPARRAIEVGEKTWRYTHQLLEGDRFWMPYLKTSLLVDFTDLIGRSHLRRANPNQRHGFTEWKIQEAQQFLHLNLSHEGVLAEAVFKISPDFLTVEGVGTKPAVNINELPEYPKNFIFNKPFLATLWLKDADWPYLACWVDGPALLRGHRVAWRNRPPEGISSHWMASILIRIFTDHFLVRWIGLVRSRLNVRHFDYAENLTLIEPIFGLRPDLVASVNSGSCPTDSFNQGKCVCILGGKP